MEGSASREIGPADPGAGLIPQQQGLFLADLGGVGVLFEDQLNLVTHIPEIHPSEFRGQLRGEPGFDGELDRQIRIAAPDQVYRVRGAFLKSRVQAVAYQSAEKP